jgi:hypothetical protein
MIDRFIRRQNVERYRRLLESTEDETQRRLVLKLLAEEQQKQKDAGDRPNMSQVGPIVRP